MQNENCYQDYLKSNPNPRTLKSFEKNQLINFSGNDYLGLSQHPELIARAQEYTKKFGTSASSSRSVTGNLACYEALENQLAENLKKPAALIMSTGFQMNFSVLQALLDPKILGKEPLVFCDRLAHVSMLLGATHLKRIHRFQHNDLAHLKILLEKYSHYDSPKFILAESIYSMDGDQADLQNLVKLAQKFHAFLYIDDAHAVGIYGLHGWGKGVEFASDIDVLMGTFSKGLGGFGAYLGCSKTVRHYLINKCKGHIYSTALPPSVLGTIAAVLDLMPHLEDERQQLRKNTQRMLAFFKDEGLNCGNANSHIIPWIIGDAKKTLYASELLIELGILGTAIRPPTVPARQCRIRFCLSAAHTDKDIARLQEAILKVERKRVDVYNPR